MRFYIFCGNCHFVYAEEDKGGMHTNCLRYEKQLPRARKFVPTRGHTMISSVHKTLDWLLTRYGLCVL
jgi:hypothetical protein